MLHYLLPHHVDCPVQVGVVRHADVDERTGGTVAIRGVYYRGRVYLAVRNQNHAVLHVAYYGVAQRYLDYRPHHVVVNPYEIPHLERAGEDDEQSAYDVRQCLL